MVACVYCVYESVVETVQLEQVIKARRSGAASGSAENIAAEFPIWPFVAFASARGVENDSGKKAEPDPITTHV